MYKKKYLPSTTIEVNEGVEGEPIEVRIERLLNNGDEIPETKELIYTRPEDGVIGEFDIRHDHWDQAYMETSTMAQKHKELDAAKLQKRKDLLQKKAEEEKFLKEQAQKEIEARKAQDGKAGEV